MNPLGEIVTRLSELENTHGTKDVIVATRISKVIGDGTINPPFVKSTLEKIAHETIRYELESEDWVTGKLTYEYVNGNKGEAKNGRSKRKNEFDVSDW